MPCLATMCLARRRCCGRSCEPVFEGWSQHEGLLNLNQGQDTRANRPDKQRAQAHNHTQNSNPRTQPTDAPHVHTHTHTHTPPATPAQAQPPPRASAPARGTIACAISTDLSAGASARCLPCCCTCRAATSSASLASSPSSTSEQVTVAGPERVCSSSSPAWAPLSGACANTEAAHAGADEGDEWDAEQLRWWLVAESGEQHEGLVSSLTGGASCERLTPKPRHTTYSETKTVCETLYTCIRSYARPMPNT